MSGVKIKWPLYSHLQLCSVRGKEHCGGGGGGWGGVEWGVNNMGSLVVLHLRELPLDWDTKVYNVKDNMNSALNF